jgi:hypothetical protein
MCNTLSGVIGGQVRTFVGSTLGLLIVGLCAVQTFAGDVSAAPVDSLDVVGSTTNALAQVSAGVPETGPATASTSPPPASAGNGAETWMRGLHISGYLNQNLGMWQNPTALKDYTKSRNNLAVARTTLQIDENFQFNENNSFFMREWFVYEPPYSFNSAGNGCVVPPVATATNGCSGYSGQALHKTVPHITSAGGSVKPASLGHFENDFYNQYGVRDFWWQNRTGPLTTFVGNQIVQWGQSVSFRVGDVINPTDTAWAFGFANLEQSRKPQWMVHPLLYLPDYGRFGSNFLEVVWLPGFAPQWWEGDFCDGRFLGEDTKLARMNGAQPAACHGPSARFDVHHQNRYMPGINVVTRAPGRTLNGPFVEPGGGGIVGPSASKQFMLCTNLEGLILGNQVARPNFANPTSLGLRRPCKLTLSKNNLPYGSVGDKAAVDTGPFRIRGYSPQFWNEGVRYHTLLGPAELSVWYLYDNTNQGIEASAKWTPYTNLWEYDTPAENLAGITGDMPLPLPESIAEHLPMVGRAEMTYINHKNFNDQRPYTLTTRRFSDVVNWMAAVDLTNAYAPWLTSTGDLSANLEVFDSIVMDKDKFMPYGTVLDEPIEKNLVSTLLNVGTSFYYGDIAPTWTMIFAPKGRTFLLFPAVTLNPPWTKKYFMRLQAIEVMGGDHIIPEGGYFKGESLLTAQFQYNFDIM